MLMQVSLQVADALEQPFPDGMFDLVWSMESGEHMPDKRKVTCFSLYTKQVVFCLNYYYPSRKCTKISLLVAVKLHNV